MPRDFFGADSAGAQAGWVPMLAFYGYSARRFPRLKLLYYNEKMFYYEKQTYVSMAALV